MKRWTIPCCCTHVGACFYVQLINNSDTHNSPTNILDFTERPLYNAVFFFACKRNFFASENQDRRPEEGRVGGFGPEAQGTDRPGVPAGGGKRAEGPQ